MIFGRWGHQPNPTPPQPYRERRSTDRPITGEFKVKGTVTDTEVREARRVLDEQRAAVDALGVSVDLKSPMEPFHGERRAT